MLKKTLIVVALGALSTLAIAGEDDARNAAKQVIDLQDGSIAFVFPSGKMAVESRLGQAVVTKPGTTLRTADGGTITMVGDEVGYLHSLLEIGYEP